MNFKKVKSTTIDEIGHDADKNELYIKFKTGSVYIYSDVSPSMHKRLLTATSHMKHLNEHIISKRKAKKK